MAKTKTKIGILFSGGLESTSLLNHYQKLDYDIYPLYIKYGYEWENTELIYAKKIIKFYNLKLNILDYSSILNVIQLGSVNSLKDNIIPLRNLSLFTFSSIYFYNQKISKIAIGLQGSKDYPDTSLDYINKCTALIEQGLNDSNFTIEIPFYGLTKKDIFMKNNGIPLKLIFSCTNPINDKRCHKCYKCIILDNLINSNLK